jgi:hypothetical protein
MAHRISSCKGKTRPASIHAASRIPALAATQGLGIGRPPVRFSPRPRPSSYDTGYPTPPGRSDGSAPTLYDVRMIAATVLFVLLVLLVWWKFKWHVDRGSYARHYTDPVETSEDLKRADEGWD